MKTCYFIFILIFPIQFLFSQSDAQWYIWENKIGSNCASPRNLPMFIGNSFYINGVKHPGLPVTGVSGGPFQPRNDLFIIFSTGDYFNSRCNTNPFSTCSSYTLWPGLWQYSPNYDYKIDLSSLFLINNVAADNDSIAYLYYTNIYEDEDDPHHSVTLSLLQSSPTYKNILLNTLNQNQTTISAPHDVVKGKDFTLIIPSVILPFDTTDKCRSYKLEYDTAVFIFDAVLLAQAGSSITDHRSDSYLTMTIPATRNQFINFKTRHTPESDTNHQVGDSIVFKFSYNCSGISSEYVHKEPINDSHDPNFIRIECISKKTNPRFFWPFSQKYAVRYHIELFNDGLGEVDNCDIEFYLPSIANPNKIMVDNWRYGDSIGCDLKPGYLELVRVLGNPRKIKFKFNTGNLDPVFSPMNSRKATIDFCVELNSSNRDSVKVLYNLKLDSARTYFDGTPYLITHFIDPKSRNPNIEGRTTLRNECLCGCRTRNIISTTDQAPVIR